MNSSLKLILTCEHAGNGIPAAYRNLFSDAEQMLNSHRGFDPGAFDLFHDLRTLADFSQYQMTSRLLVELNRSLHHQNLFSKTTRALSTGEKEALLKDYYFPYRELVEKQISDLLKEGEKVVHLSVHSFTPNLDGAIRNTDIGLLYNPMRPEEKKFCTVFKNRLIQVDQVLKVRFNYPYLGKADGFTTYLRRKFSENYSGIELEVNQKFVLENKMQESLKQHIFLALEETLEELN